jgi:hypothetical protein
MLNYGAKTITGNVRRVAGMLGLMFCLSLAALAQASRTAQIEIQPPNPTAGDNISIRIFGTWPNTCVPQNPQVTRFGNRIFIQTSNPGEVCGQALTNWSLTVPIGQLPAGTYEVLVTYRSPSFQNNQTFLIGQRVFTVSGQAPPPPNLGAAPREAWTTVGSAGTVDEEDAGRVAFREGVAELRADAPAQTQAEIRYNVVAVDGLFGGSARRLVVRYLDNGAEAQVIVRLKSYDIFTGATVTLLTFDSNAFAPAAGFQAHGLMVCAPGWEFNFSTKAYFVEVQLIKTGVQGNAAIGIVQLSSPSC